MVRALVVAAACLAIASCAARGKLAPPAAPEATAGSATSPMPASPRDQIEELDQAIEAQRAQLGLPAPSEPEILRAPTQPMSLPPSAQDNTCKPAKNETCDASCRISDSICKNADKICKLAQELGDAWSANKCAKANTTCEASRAKCCSCQ